MNPTPETPESTLRLDVDEAAVARAIQRIEKRYGLGAVMRLGDEARQGVRSIPTGSILLDRATGIGGYPLGRVVEIYGPESSGKTTLALHAIAHCQRAGGQAAFIDVEHALDPTYAAALGVRLDELLVSQPDHGEQALDICESLVASGGVRLVVLDSVAALVPLAELEGEMGDQQVGLQARLMSKALRKITGLANRHDTTVIFINQLRQKIGVTFGSGEVTTGGNALKFYASLRLDVRRIGTINDGGQATAARTRVRVVKNKLAPPFRQVEFEIVFGRGIHTVGELFDLALDRGLISRSGSWYALGDQTIGQGREASRAWLVEHPEALDRLRALLAEPPAGEPAEA